jgi:hypothetical protein
MLRAQSALRKEFTGVVAKMQAIPALKDKSIIKYLFAKADKDGSGALSREEVYELASYMNIEASQKEMEHCFNYFDTTNKSSSRLNYLDEDEFTNFLYLLLSRIFIDLQTQGTLLGVTYSILWSAKLMVLFLCVGGTFQRVSRYGFVSDVVISLDETCI